MKHKPMPELNYLRNILDYNPDTGEFRWKVNRGSNKVIGQIAGTLFINPHNNNKYYHIQINKKLYLLHRLAFYYITGIDPAKNQIDHINGNSLDNTFKNLRLATHANNAKNCKIHKNNSSGFKGVFWSKTHKKWTAQITVNRKKIHLGRYKNKFYAALVYARAAKKYFGEFRRKG